MESSANADMGCIVVAKEQKKKSLKTGICWQQQEGDFGNKMDMTKIMTGIEKIADEELKRAVATYGTNHSRHEGYAVLKEEFEEFETEYDNMVSKMADIWNNIKADSQTEEMRKDISTFLRYAMMCSAELVQVIAMAVKMQIFEVDGK